MTEKDNANALSSNTGEISSLQDLFSNPETSENQEEYEMPQTLNESTLEDSSLPENSENLEKSNIPPSEQAVAIFDQAELRKRIIAIQTDLSITSSDKARKVQELMTRSWNARQKNSGNFFSIQNKLSEKEHDFGVLKDGDTLPSWSNKDLEIMGCKHYHRGAKLQAYCCGKWFTCRFCHDEVSDHNIVRNLTNTMMCMHCSHVQSAAKVCIACKKVLAKYYCAQCRLWDDDSRKNIYHCVDCGICRIGKGLGQDYFHCNKCNVCMAISLQGKHKCIERNLESDCPICGEFMFTSTTTVIFMPCGHCIHYKCHQEYIQSSYQCPTCSKSLANMVDYFKRIDAMLALHSMPKEYRNTLSNIYCNDCEKKSVAKYHFLYHKCEHCKGYNSKMLSTFEFDCQITETEIFVDAVEEDISQLVE